MESIGDHKLENDCWMSYKGKTLDVTKFLNQHPGGKEILVPYYGKDISQAFDDENHSETAYKLLDEFVIGLTPQVPSRKIDPYKGMVYQLWQGVSMKDYTDMINLSLIHI